MRGGSRMNECPTNDAKIKQICFRVKHTLFEITKIHIFHLKIEDVKDRWFHETVKPALLMLLRRVS